MNECLTTPQHEKQIGYWVSGADKNMHIHITGVGNGGGGGASGACVPTFNPTFLFST